MALKPNKFSHHPKGQSSKKVGHDEIMLTLKRIYFDYLEDVFNKPKLAYNNPIENLSAQLCVREKYIENGFIKKLPHDIYSAALAYADSGANYDDGNRSFAFIENKDAKPINIYLEK